MSSKLRLRKQPRNFQLEPLEPRHLLAADVLISELSADNQSGLRDDDGDRSDWIELFNPGDAPLDLTGWHLTDDPNEAAKWSFPAVTLSPRSYLVVFASGKDRADPSEQLHTNFKLSVDGEHLSLTGPDGSTVASAFSPAYPPQHSDVTFGIPQEVISDQVVGADSTHRIFIPSADDDGPTQGTAWTELEFDDVAWQRGPGPIGFGAEFDNLVGTNVRETMRRVSSAAYVRVPFQMPDTQHLSGLELRMQFSHGFDAYLNGQLVAQRDPPGPPVAFLCSVTERDFQDELVIDLSEFIGLLEDGDNILAVRGMASNRSASSFLLGFELVGERPGALASGEHGFFRYPTPGEPNGIESFAGKVEDVTVSVPRGFYDQPQQVTLTSATAGARIVYTVDGSEPTLENGIRVEPPSHDQAPNAILEINATTILRVAGLSDDYLPSSTETHTYLFLDDVIRQSPGGETPPGWPTAPINEQQFDYGMDPDIVDDPEFGPQLKDALGNIPTFSLVTDRDYLFDEQMGVYVNGLIARQRNDAFESPTSVELIHPDQTVGFQIDAGLRLRGGASRCGDNPKHAFRLLFRTEYGDAKLRYPLFGADVVDEFDNLDLRTAQAPSWSWSQDANHTMVRDVFSRDTQRDMGRPHTRSQYYHLYLNGQYWGLYQTQERPEASFAESYLGGDKDDYDVIKVEGFPHHVRATDGNMDAWRRLWEMGKAGFRDDDPYMKVQGKNLDGTRNDEYPVLLDIDNLIDYMLVIFYTGDRDGPISDFGNNAVANNFFAIRNRQGDKGFQFFAHDSEWTLMDVDQNRLGPWPAGNTFQHSNPQWIHQKLMANENYRQRFADRAHQHLFNGGALTPEAALQRIQNRVDQIDLAIIAESARWGDAQRRRPYTRNDWEAAVRRITEDFIPQRREILIDQLTHARLTTNSDVETPLYSLVEAPSFSQHGGLVDRGFSLTIHGANVYYTLDGSDPRLENPSSAVVELVGTESHGTYIVPSDETLGLEWTGTGFEDSDWHPVEGGVGFGRRFEDVVTTDVSSLMKGQNASAYFRYAFDLADPSEQDWLRFGVRYDDGFVAYLNGAEIARRNAPEVVTWQSTATAIDESEITIDVSRFVSHLQTGTNVLAIHGLNRSASGSDFLMRANLTAGTLVDTGARPSALKYEGPIRLTGNTSVKARTLADAWGPLIEATFVSENWPLRISEIMYHPSEPTDDERTQGFTDDDEFEYIEFLNTSKEQSLQLKGFSIREGIEFEFPDLVLEPGGRTVVVRDHSAIRHRYGDLLNVAGEYLGRLNNRSDVFAVIDPLGREIQTVSYADSWYPTTDGEGRSLEFTAADFDDAEIWSTAAAWSPSFVFGGTPARDRLVPGDSNRDGVFNSSDLVQVFQSGQYEDDIIGNSTFETGDWNGDGDFDSSDLVLAFQQGSYLATAKELQLLRQRYGRLEKG